VAEFMGANILADCTRQPMWHNNIMAGRIEQHAQVFPGSWPWTFDGKPWRARRNWTLSRSLKTVSMA
jgi:hypothetical protein